MGSINAIPSEVNEKVILTLIGAESGHLNFIKVFLLFLHQSSLHHSGRSLTTSLYV